jgi:thiol-disulfide isomerase/thioredoxin
MKSQDAALWDSAEATKVVGLKRPVAVEEPTATIAADGSNALEEQKGRNVAVAIVSVVLAIGNFFWQYSHPVTGVQLLFSMQQASAPITAIGTNGKPSVVDFWAPWCENCKFSAPTLQRVEEEYKDKVNFVMVNGDQAQSWPYIEAFGVDAIPHLALVSADGDVMTALIGPTPKSVLEADLNMMIKNAKAKQEEAQQPLPYVMMDAFANAPQRRRVHFDE